MGPFFAAALLVLMLPPGARLNAKQAAAQSKNRSRRITRTAHRSVARDHGCNAVRQSGNKNAYALAAKVKCYTSLATATATGPMVTAVCLMFRQHSRFNVRVCMGEALYTYEQTRAGKTPAQIREGIERGDWQHVDLAKYKKYPMRP
jgi:hypothetical protein